MKTIKLKYTDFYRQFEPEQFPFTKILREAYHVVFSDEPDYLIYGPFGDEHLKYRNCVRIFFTGENVAPDFNFCDYAVGFEYLSLLDRYYRLPLFYLYDESMFCGIAERPKIADSISREKFCSFVVSNGNATYRDACFEALCGYKKVDSGGRYKNNIGKPGGVEDKLAFDQEHKFSLCFENESHPGYTTEKLLQAFAAGCIPIYWGDPLAGKVFNEKAFIDVNQYPDFSAVIERVKEIDQDDKLYRQMLKEPVFLHREDYPEVMLSGLSQFLRHIFDQPIQAAGRRSASHFVDRYFSVYENGANIRNVSFWMKKLGRKFFKIGISR